MLQLWNLRVRELTAVKIEWEGGTIRDRRVGKYWICSNDILLQTNCKRLFHLLWKSPPFFSKRLHRYSCPEDEWEVEKGRKWSGKKVDSAVFVFSWERENRQQERKKWDMDNSRWERGETWVVHSYVLLFFKWYTNERIKSLSYYSVSQMSWTEWEIVIWWSKR